MQIKDIMTTDIVSVDKDESLSRVLDLMKKYNITKIPVLDQKKFFGLATDNVIAYKLGLIRKREVPASHMHASTVTEKQVPTIAPTDELQTILKRVGEPGPTMLPVLEKGKLVGVVTKADLLPLVTNKAPLHSIMQRHVHTVAADERIIHARRLMITQNVARLPVIERGKLVGIMSDIEIAHAFASLKKKVALGQQKRHLDDLLVKDVMRSHVISTPSTTRIVDAAALMLKENVGCLPIVDNEILIGMVSRTDLLKTIKQ